MKFGKRYERTSKIGIREMSYNSRLPLYGPIVHIITDFHCNVVEVLEDSSTMAALDPISS